MEQNISTAARAPKVWGIYSPSLARFITGRRWSEKADAERALACAKPGITQSGDWTVIRDEDAR